MIDGGRGICTDTAGLFLIIDDFIDCDLYRNEGNVFKRVTGHTRYPKI